MKQIAAVIQPFKLEAVRTALADLGIEGMTVSEVKGFGRQKGQTEVYRGVEYHIHYTAKLKLEVVVADSIADQVVDAIRVNANQNRIGDGKIFVWNIEHAHRVRTGETGEEAL